MAPLGHGAASRRHADDEDLGAVGGLRQLVGLGHDGRAADDGDAGQTGARDAFDGLRPDRRQIEAPVLIRAWAP